MADRIGMTYSRLRKEFTRKLGVPPRQFVNRERMHLACNLLEGGALAKEACFAIGMKDVGHFSKLFKRIVGMGPKEFARSGERRG